MSIDDLRFSNQMIGISKEYQSLIITSFLYGFSIATFLGSIISDFPTTFDKMAALILVLIYNINFNISKERVQFGFSITEERIKHFLRWDKWNKKQHS